MSFNTPNFSNDPIIEAKKYLENCIRQYMPRIGNAIQSKDYALARGEIENLEIEMENFYDKEIFKLAQQKKLDSLIKRRVGAYNQALTFIDIFMESSHLAQILERHINYRNTREGS